MNLTRKSNEPREQKVIEPVDQNLFEVDWDAYPPYGKYQQQTLRWIKANDDSYYKWMLAENMIDKWFMYKVRGAVMKVKKAKPQWDPWLNTDTGEWYMGIRICEGDGVPYEE